MSSVTSLGAEEEAIPPNSSSISPRSPPQYGLLCFPGQHCQNLTAHAKCKRLSAALEMPNSSDSRQSRPRSSHSPLETVSYSAVHPELATANSILHQQWGATPTH
ncbi:unnamed protein product [Periconia digitata]|uniref:Uncharacterized protein n=1 Tax=Periconia digitata TaxID=1303443 RepID=A0A9W4UFK8_9PLEO|nr:unnamed protein product [Periconia digitata]